MTHADDRNPLELAEARAGSGLDRALTRLTENANLDIISGEEGGVFELSAAVRLVERIATENIAGMVAERVHGRDSLDGPSVPRAEAIAGSIDADRAEDARIARALGALDNDPIAALDRADVEFAVGALKMAQDGWDARGYAEVGRCLALVADALTEGLRARE